MCEILQDAFTFQYFVVIYDLFASQFQRISNPLALLNVFLIAHIVLTRTIKVHKLCWPTSNGFEPLSISNFQRNQVLQFASPCSISLRGPEFVARKEKKLLCIWESSEPRAHTHGYWKSIIDHRPRSVRYMVCNCCRSIFISWMTFFFFFLTSNNITVLLFIYTIFTSLFLAPKLAFDDEWKFDQRDVIEWCDSSWERYFDSQKKVSLSNAFVSLNSVCYD